MVYPYTILSAVAGSEMTADEPGYVFVNAAPVLREAIATAGLATPADVDEIIKLCDQPRLSLVSPVTMGAWGHRPVI